MSSHKHYYFIGIGGIGMGALASLLLAKGHKVSGSDLRGNELTDKLKEQGAQIFVGHDAHHLQGCDCVVFSSAISEDNVELTAAQALDLRILRRAELLAELMKDHQGITIAGAHGKTTTTSMVSHILIAANLQPTTAVGGVVLGASTHARLGAGKYFVAEADESDRSFLNFTPKYSIITNIDLEHVDQYSDWDEIKDVYQQFINCTQPEGMIFGCGEDKNLLELLKKSKHSFKTYGLSSDYDVYATDIKNYDFSTSFDCHVKGNNLGQVILEIPGTHNVLNALASISLALTLGVDFKTISLAFKSFHGVKRRFEKIDEQNSILIIDDYAHHPTEITATLKAAQKLKKGKLVTIFQPHRYTRLKALLDDFTQSLLNTDYLIITDVYAASESPIEGISGEKLAACVRSLTDKPVHYLPKDEIVAHLLEILEPGDLALTLGAGDITEISKKLSQGLKGSIVNH